MPWIHDRRPAYGAFVYHDEPEEGAANHQYLGDWPTVPAAAAEIRQNLGHHWHYGSIHLGYRVTRIVDGLTLVDFETNDHETPWQVGADYLERG